MIYLEAPHPKVKGEIRRDGGLAGLVGYRSLKLERKR